ncbi:hypothetical protein ARMSODRAFT_983714 [Armillaria solidipes]|uniref:Uncharacterized protein n=1 Tax=Armillaria solidipes TaxID=1076256 RepID=A0A2H3B411_9AGAR|nr:hypothetical protein ARMSODRAFT_983714 [Armillaria solidipes]
MPNNPDIQPNTSFRIRWPTSLATAEESDRIASNSLRWLWLKTHTNKAFALVHMLRMSRSKGPGDEMSGIHDVEQDLWDLENAPSSPLCRFTMWLKRSYYTVHSGGDSKDSFARSRFVYEYMHKLLEDRMVEFHDHMVVTLTDVFAPMLPRKFSGSPMPVDAGAYLLALEEKVNTDIDPVLQRMKIQISAEWRPLILPTGDGYQALVRANHRWIEEEWLEKFRTGMASLTFHEFDLLGSRHIAPRKYLLENSKQSSVQHYAISKLLDTENNAIFEPFRNFQRNAVEALLRACLPILPQILPGAATSCDLSLVKLILENKIAAEFDIAVKEVQRSISVQCQSFVTENSPQDPASSSWATTKVHRWATNELKLQLEEVLASLVYPDIYVKRNEIIMQWGGQSHGG